MNTIPFSPPHIDQAVIDEVIDSLRSGWITTGPKTKQLEREVEGLSGARRVLCVNSATAGMELILRWLGVGPGDEVIVPAYTYCATANVVIHCGATPVMVDVLPADGTIDPKAVANAITPRTKAIMPVDLGGMPARYTELWNLLDNPSVQQLFQPANPVQEQLGRIALITDAAHSIGAEYEGQPAALQADVAVFSFHAVKNLTTAEGGAVCLNLPDSFDAEAIYQQLNTLSLHGQSKDALAKLGKNAWEYDVAEAGYKCNLPDVLAAIGLASIGRYRSETLPKRRALFQAYDAALEPYEWAQLPRYETKKRTSSYHLYLLRIRDIDLAARNAVIQRIFDQGVSVNVHYKPLPLLSFYQKLGYQMSDYPVSLDFYQRVITLPVYFDLDLALVPQVIEAVAKAVDR